jgi:ATP-dependent RNA helicase DDX51/DBP6
LTSDPGKIASLGLRDPKYFVIRETTTGAADSHRVVSESFSMPANLTVGFHSAPHWNIFLKPYIKEHMIVCNPFQKPLILFYLVHFRRVDSALIFTKSAESTARLVKLFELFEGNYPITGNHKLIIRSYSSDLPPSERKSILEEFKEKKIGV